MRGSLVWRLPCKARPRISWRGIGGSSLRVHQVQRRSLLTKSHARGPSEVSMAIQLQERSAPLLYTQCAPPLPLFFFLSTVELTSQLALYRLAFLYIISPHCLNKPSEIISQTLCPNTVTRPRLCPYNPRAHHNMLIESILVSYRPIRRSG